MIRVKQVKLPSNEAIKILLAYEILLADAATVNQLGAYVELP